MSSSTLKLSELNQERMTMEHPGHDVRTLPERLRPKHLTQGKELTGALAGLGPAVLSQQSKTCEDGRGRLFI